ncbi:gnat family protein [Curvularia clavata]|uniref:Gnat family protein n=1 Tax=Curvularia clavata TaxID=95742 RepID=A0A9Q8ZBQ6_CURCL|nr:gnat family protein [Curvularia clavata]
MPLELHRITSPDDFETFSTIQLAAFASGGGIAALLSPDLDSKETQEKYVERHIQSWRDEPDVVYLKVVDTDIEGGKMIAGAKWRINEKERSEEVVEKMYPKPQGKDLEKPAVVDFFAFLSRVRKQYMGTKPFCFLHILVTHPDHHRKGAGTMLLNWGISKADSLGLPAFLESSAMGRPLYERLGFQAREVVTFDLKKYGLEGTDTNTVMIREPLSNTA